MFDPGPQAERLGALVTAVRDDQLTSPTPSGTYTLGDLLDHVSTVAVGFRDAAIKATDGVNSRPPPQGDAARLPADWRTRIPTDLIALGAAWSDPAAWDGTTGIAGDDGLPPEVVAGVLANELVVHGWDVARASGQPFDADPELVAAAFEFIESFSQTEMEEQDGAPFGPVVDVADDAPALTRLVGLNGRDPNWSAG